MKTELKEKKYPILCPDGNWRDSARRIFDPEKMLMSSDGVTPSVTHGGYFRFKEHNAPIIDSLRVVEEESSSMPGETVDLENEATGDKNGISVLGYMFLVCLSFGAFIIALIANNRSSKKEDGVTYKFI